MATNLIGPGASGSVADVLRSARTFQPWGAWATSVADTNSAISDAEMNVFMPIIMNSLCLSWSGNREGRGGANEEPGYGPGGPSPARVSNDGGPSWLCPWRPS